MYAQQLLWQLDAVRRTFLTVQKFQNQVLQTKALLRTAGNIADLCSLAGAVNQIRGAWRPVNGCLNRRFF